MWIRQISWGEDHSKCEAKLYNDAKIGHSYTAIIVMNSQFNYEFLWENQSIATHQRIDGVYELQLPTGEQGTLTVRPI